MMIMMAICYQTGNVEGNMILGYATMLLAFSLIYVGIKTYRDKHNNGIISFGKAFKIGLYISLIASTIYVIVWLVDYHIFIPDFMDKYTTAVLAQTKAEGASRLELDKKAAEMAFFKEMYKNPLMIVLFTYAEILPVGLLVTLISALLLKRKGTKRVQPAI
jgi:small basic protein